MDRWGHVLVASLYCLTAISTVAGLRCVQCISESSKDCIDRPPPPQLCDVEAQYCITVRERLPNDTLTSVTRGCSPSNIGHECQEGFSAEGHIVEICHESCNKEGCNGSHQMESFFTIIVISSLFIIFYSYHNNEWQL